MNAQLLEQARAAYRSGDFSAAAQMFSSVKTPDEINGEVDHLHGNSLMRLGMFRDAAACYAAALADTAYGKRGALLTNQGKALAATGDFSSAAECFSAATQDATYATPYKAYMGLGGALLSSGNVAEAGTAYRQAAIDGTNPAPAGALSKLAECFLELGRPEDAVESFRTALDFVGPRDDVRAINAGLGQALSAAGHPADALEAFNNATADGIYQLTQEQQNELQRVHDALDAAAARNAISTDTVPGAPAPYDEQAAFDAIDPLGKSGQFMPDPSDTGFFTLSEQEMVQQDRKQAKVRRRHRHTGLKVFIVILILLVAVLGGGGYLYTHGFGIPSQESVLNELLSAKTDNDTGKGYGCISADSDAAKELIFSEVPSGASATIKAMDQGMSESTATVEIKLSKGGTQTYKVTFTRNDLKIGWAVASIDFDFESASTDSALASDSSTTSTDDTSASTDASASDVSSDTASTDEAASDEGASESSDSSEITDEAPVE